MRIGIKRSVAKAICRRWGLPLLVSKAHKYISRWLKNGHWSYRYPCDQHRKSSRRGAKLQVALKTTPITGIQPLVNPTQQDVEREISRLKRLSREGKLVCPALGGDNIIFDDVVFEHMKKTKGRERSLRERKNKVKFLPLTQEILQHGRISERSYRRGNGSERERLTQGIICRVRYKNQADEVIESAVEIAVIYGEDKHKYVFSFSVLGEKKLLPESTRVFDRFEEGLATSDNARLHKIADVTTSKSYSHPKMSIPHPTKNASRFPRFMVKKSVAKAICGQWGLPCVRKGNLCHDQLGRFADGAVPFTDEIKGEVIERIKNSTTKMRVVEYSRENYDRLFPEGKIETPIGKVRMSRHQFERIGVKDNGKRKVLLGAIHQTLSEPDVIIKDLDSQGREAKLYIKSFLGGKAGKKIVFSVVPNINGDHVSVSNGLRKLKNAEDKIKRANIFYYKAEGGGSTTGTAENSDVAQQKTIVSQVVKKSSNYSPRLMLRKSVVRRALRAPLPRLAFTKSGRLVVRK